MAELLQWLETHYPTVFFNTGMAIGLLWVLRMVNNRFPQLRNRFALWLIDDDDAPNYVGLISSALHDIYGERFWSLRTFRRVALTSVVSFCVVFFVVLSTYPVFYESLAGIARLDLPVAMLGGALFLLIAVVFALAINVPIDLLSFWQTRMVLSLVQPTSLVGGLVVLAVDFIVSAMIPVVLTAVYLAGIKGLTSGGPMAMAMLGAADYWQDIFRLYYQGAFGDPPTYESGQSYIGPLQATIAITTLFWSIVISLFVLASLAIRSFYAARRGLSRTFGWHDHDWILQNPITFVGEYAAILMFTLLTARDLLLG